MSINAPVAHSQPSIVERLRVWPAAYGEEDGLSSKYTGRVMKQAAGHIEQLQEALSECLGQLGWTNYTDDEMREEAALGNERAPIILRARAALEAKPAGEMGE